MLKHITRKDYFHYMSIILLPASIRKEKLKETKYSKEQKEELAFIHNAIAEKIRVSNDQNILLETVINQYFNKLEISKKNKTNFIDKCSQ